MSFNPFKPVSGSLFERRWIGWLLALLLIATSLVLAWQREREQIAAQSRETTVHAQILADSIAGAVAFDDDLTVREALDSLRLDSGILAAAAYPVEGRIIAGFTRDGQALPQRVQAGGPQLSGRVISVVVPVRQGDLELGYVYLRTSVEPFSSRIWRYAAIGVVLLMAALLIAVLGASTAAAIAANRKLQEEVAARERAERALHQAQKMEALGQLTGGVAHDFNNLLMAASSGLELLERTRDPERRRQFTNGIRDALDHGARVTRQLLAFSRRSPLQPQAIFVADGIDNLAELLRHSLGEDISVNFEIAEGLWPIEVDPSQFDVAILNIALNARDALPEGGVIRVEAVNRPGGLEGRDAVEICVEDRGTGMSPEALEKAFEPFFTTKEVGKGTGLGLSQVYGFAHGAGGTVTVRSEPGEGTVVAMIIPRHVPRESEPPDAAEAEPAK